MAELEASEKIAQTAYIKKNEQADFRESMILKKKKKKKKFEFFDCADFSLENRTDTLSHFFVISFHLLGV